MADGHVAPADKVNKPFKKSTRGKKVNNRKDKDGRHRHNAKAFTFSGGVVARAKAIGRSAAIFQIRARRNVFHKSMAASFVQTQPPKVVAVQGPPGSGKTTLIRSLVFIFTGIRLDDVVGPVTINIGKQRRLTLLEIPSRDTGAMLDASKMADFVLCTCNATVGVENDTLEMINCLKVHGMPRVWLVLTQLDTAKKMGLKVPQNKIKHRFMKETYNGNKVFMLYGLDRKLYRETAMHSLLTGLRGENVQALKYRDSHSYICAILLRDVTADKVLRDSAESNRDVELYGYVQGARLRRYTNVHIPGAGDFRVRSVDKVPDPCELPLAKQGKGADGTTKDGGKALRKLKNADRKMFAAYSSMELTNTDRNRVTIKLPTNRVLFTEHDQLQMTKAHRDVEAEVLSAGGVVPEDVQRVRSLRIDEAGAAGEGHESQEGELENQEYDSEDNTDDEDVSYSYSSDEEGGLCRKRKLKAALSLDSPFRDLTHSVVSTTTWLNEDIIQGGARDQSIDLMTHLRGSTEVSGLRGGIAKLSDVSIRRSPLISSLLLWRHCGVVSSVVEQRFVGKRTDDVDATRDLRKKRSRHDIDEQEAGSKTETSSKLKDADGRELPMNAAAECDYKLAVRAAMEKKLDAIAFSGMDANRSGAAVGAFVKIRVSDVPFKWVVQRAVSLQRSKGWQPILIGELLPGEQKRVLVQSKIRIHRYREGRQIMNHDPCIFSVGWRRYQAIPTFAAHDRNNVRIKQLKTTLPSEHCLVFNSGYNVQPGTGMLMIQDTSESRADYAISATGDVQQCAENFKVMKKLNMEGYPVEISGHSAVISGMFNSDLEVSKAKECRIQTVSGIRGKVGNPLGPGGRFRAKFEGPPLKSDIIKLKMWAVVPIKKQLIDYTDWDGVNMRRGIWQLRHDNRIGKPDIAETDYGSRQERPERHEKILGLSQSLVASLPLDSEFLRSTIVEKRVERDVSDIEEAIADIKSDNDKERLLLLKDLRTLKSMTAEKQREKLDAKQATRDAIAAKEKARLVGSRKLASQARFSGIKDSSSKRRKKN